MKWNLKREIFPFIIIAIYGILSIYFYPTLPESVPSHFNKDGLADRYSSKLLTVLAYVGLALLLYLILTFIPFIDPFWKKIQKKYSLFLLLRNFILLFFLFLYLLTLLSAKAGRLPKNVLGVGFGFLFVLVGNYLPKLPRNFFFGVRVPWTLASETVWRKTHVLCGWVFVISGILVIIFSLLKINLAISFLVTLVPLFLFSGFIYPLLLCKKLQKEEKIKAPEF
jgi:uncharacterized membrane protein